MKYWTALNKGYGCSRLFGNLVHFAVDPASDSDDLGAAGASGGGGSNDDSEMTVEELKAALAKAQGERDAAILQRDKNKRSLDTALKDLGAAKKKNREAMSADQQFAAEKQELLDRIAELEGQSRTSAYTKRLMGIGMAEDKATNLASLIPAFKEEDDADVFFAGLSEFIAAATKTAGEEAVQKLIQENHIDIAGGSGSNKESTAVEIAKRLSKSRGSANNDIVKNYIR